MKSTARITLHIAGLLFFGFSASIYVEAIVPDAYNPLDVKPNMEEDLKPVKYLLAWILLTFGWLVLLTKYLFRK